MQRSGEICWLNYQRYGTFAHIYEGQPEEKSYAWTLTQVKSILKDETYIGNSVHNKQTNISYKNKKKIRNLVQDPTLGVILITHNLKENVKDTLDGVYKLGV